MATIRRLVQPRQVALCRSTSRSQCSHQTPESRENPASPRPAEQSTIATDIRRLRSATRCRWSLKPSHAAANRVDAAQVGGSVRGFERPLRGAAKEVAARIARSVRAVRMRISVSHEWRGATASMVRSRFPTHAAIAPHGWGTRFLGVLSCTLDNGKPSWLHNEIGDGAGDRRRYPSNGAI